MSDRAIASTNQWKDRKGASVAPLFLIDSVFSGFVTIADAGTAAARLSDAVFSGFLTPDGAATPETATGTLLLVGDSFALLSS